MPNSDKNIDTLLDSAGQVGDRDTMPGQLQTGHYYERRDGVIVGPAKPRTSLWVSSPFVWKVGVRTYTDHGEYSKLLDGARYDLVKDLGIIDPRPLNPQPRKAPP